MTESAGIITNRTTDNPYPFGIGIVNIPSFRDKRGTLSVAEGMKGDVPFEIARAFWITGIPGDSCRAGHAHLRQSQIIVAVSGSFRLTLDDGFSKHIIVLDNPTSGLLVGPAIWITIDKFSDNAVCLVLASDLYDEDEYIHDYGQFISIARHPQEEMRQDG